MKTSPHGLEFLSDLEGNKLRSYLDGGGVWTIGVGHTSDEVFKVEPDQQITYEKSMELLAYDVEEAEDIINELVKVPLTQNQYDALVSFVFNIGATQFSDSTLLRKLNAKDYFGASAQLTRWNRDNGKTIAGLTKRRLLEQSLFRQQA